MDKNGLFFRTFEITEVRADEKSRELEISFSSEIPVERWFGMEVLCHKEGAVDLKRAHTLLMNHRPDNIVGPIKRKWIDGDKGRAIVAFDETSEGELRKKQVESGSLRGVSVGYAVKRFKRLAPGEEYELAGGKIKGPSEKEESGRGPVYIAEKWAPIEISLTPIPADHTVGIGRDATRSLEGIEIEEHRLEEPAPEGQHTEGGTEDMDEKELQAKIDAALAKEREANKTRFEGILNRAKVAGPAYVEMAMDLYREGKSDLEISDALLAAKTKERGTPGNPGEGERGSDPFNGVTEEQFARSLADPVVYDF